MKKKNKKEPHSNIDNCTQKEPLVYMCIFLPSGAATPLHREEGLLDPPPFF